MRHPVSKHLFAYWRRLRGPRPAPERADINPADLGRLLPHMFVLEGTGDGAFRIRIAGSRLCALFDTELRGTDLQALMAPEAVDDLRDILAIVATDLNPVIAGASVLLMNEAPAAAELLLLPLLHRSQPGERLLGCLTFGAELPPPRVACLGIDIISFRVIDDSETRFLHPPEPELPIRLRGMAERRGHLTVLEGGQHP